nr:MAG TPA: hypothetical protein [Caudoviricetes sp.]
MFFLQWFSDLWKPPKEKALWGFHKTIQSFVRSAAIVHKVYKVSDQKSFYILAVSNSSAGIVFSDFLCYNVF